MQDLMPLAKPVNIGKLVVLNRVSGDAGVVVRSVSGQVPVPLVFGQSPLSTTKHCDTG